MRSSALPVALESAWGSLHIDNPTQVKTADVCPWSDGEYKPVHWTEGFTTFTTNDLIQHKEHLLSGSGTTWKTTCKKPGYSCYSDPANCMAPCSDEQVTNEGYVRMPLEVSANGSPDCTADWNNRKYGPYVVIKCNMKPYGFGQDNYNGYNRHAHDSTCNPWADLELVNTVTGQFLPIAYVLHWSWSPNDRLVYFAPFKTTSKTAYDAVNNMFNNQGRDEPLAIELRHRAYNPTTPVGYNPNTLPAFTMVYGEK